MENDRLHIPEKSGQVTAARIFAFIFIFVIGVPWTVGSSIAAVGAAVSGEQISLPLIVYVISYAAFLLFLGIGVCAVRRTLVPFAFCWLFFAAYILADLWVRTSVGQLIASLTAKAILSIVDFLGIDPTVITQILDEITAYLNALSLSNISIETLLQNLPIEIAKKTLVIYQLVAAAAIGIIVVLKLLRIFRPIRLFKAILIGGGVFELLSSFLLYKAQDVFWGILMLMAFALFVLFILCDRGVIKKKRALITLTWLCVALHSVAAFSLLTSLLAAINAVVRFVLPVTALTAIIIIAACCMLFYLPMLLIASALKSGTEKPKKLSLKKDKENIDALPQHNN